MNNQHCILTAVTAFAFAFSPSALNANDFALPASPMKAVYYTGSAGSSFMTAQAAIKGSNQGDNPPFVMINAQLAGYQAQAVRTEVASVELSTLLDRHWKTNLVYTLGGKKVNISGTFDRKSNAYLSVLVAGEKTPTFYDLKSLLDAPATVKIGAATYSIYLAANPVKPLKSRIILENEADEDDFASIRVGKLLDAVEAAGTLVTLSNQSYRLFYIHDVKKSGAAAGVELDPDSRTFVMIFKNEDGLHVFLIPAEQVPSDKISIFKMFDDKPVGFKTVGGKIKIYENP